MVSLSSLLILFKQYSYALLFPVAVIEGPMISVIGGFLVSLGFFNWFIMYIILVLGDVVGDILHYAIGRYWGQTAWIQKYGRFVGYDERNRVLVEEHFRKHPAKTFLLAKVAHGVGGIVLIVAGIVRSDFLYFVLLNLLGTIPKTLILFLIGFYAGSSYTQISSYLNSFGYAVVGITISLVVAYAMISKWAGSFFKKEQNHE